MNQGEKPLPDPNDIYPDPQKRAQEIFAKEDKAKKKDFLRTVLIILFLIVLGFFAYRFYKSDLFQAGKEKVTGKISDETLKNDLSRVKTVSSYYYRSYKSFEGMDNDMDLKTVSSDIYSDGGQLHLQGLTETTFVAWLTLPNSKQIYCTDATGFTGVVSSVGQTTCNK